MLGIAHVAIQGKDLTFLDPAHTRNQPEQGRFADAVRPDQPDHAASRYFEGQIIERDSPAVPVRHAPHPRGNRRHHGSFTANLSGQAASRLVRTYPMPRIPVLSCFSYRLRSAASPDSLTRNISFSRSSGVSTVFGVNCASVATKVTFVGNT